MKQSVRKFEPQVRKKQSDCWRGGAVHCVLIYYIPTKYRIRTRDPKHEFTKWNMRFPKRRNRIQHEFGMQLEQLHLDTKHFWDRMNMQNFRKRARRLVAISFEGAFASVFKNQVMAVTASRRLLQRRWVRIIRQQGGHFSRCVVQRVW